MNIQTWHGGKIVLLWLTAIVAGGSAIAVALVLGQFVLGALFSISVVAIFLWALTWHWLGVKEMNDLHARGLRMSPGMHTDDWEEWDDDAAPEENDEQHLERLMEVASDYWSHSAEHDYLHKLAREEWERAYPLWRLRYPSAALALDSFNEDYDDFGETLVGLDEDEQTRILNEWWLQRDKKWRQKFSAAAGAYDRMTEEIYFEFDQLSAIANIPEVIEARYRDKPESMPGRLGERYCSRLRREALERDPEGQRKAEAVHRAVISALSDSFVAFEPFQPKDARLSFRAKEAEATHSLVEEGFVEIHEDPDRIRARFASDPVDLPEWQRKQWIRLCRRAGFDPQARQGIGP